jgi:hypothetical protein
VTPWTWEEIAEKMNQDCSWRDRLYTAENCKPQFFDTLQPVYLTQKAAQKPREGDDYHEDADHFDWSD